MSSDPVNQSAPKKPIRRQHASAPANARSNRTRAAGSVRASVVDAIRRGILDNQLAPGQRLVVKDLSELFGVSPVAIRAALADLTYEGLVEGSGARIARVRVIGLDEALEIVEARAALEAVCVARAAEVITDQEIIELRALGAKLQRSGEAGDVEGFAKFTNEIFGAYVRIAGKPVIGELLGRLRTRNARHPFKLTYRPERARIATPFWVERVEAICNRDPDAARASVERHARNVRESMTVLAKEAPPFWTERVR